MMAREHYWVECDGCGQPVAFRSVESGETMTPESCTGLACESCTEDMHPRLAPRTQGEEQAQAARREARLRAVSDRHLAAYAQGQAMRDGRSDHGFAPRRLTGDDHDMAERACDARRADEEQARRRGR